MRKLLNTLYVTSEDAYLALEGETVKIMFEDNSSKNVPLINLQGIVCFSYKGASPALMGKCADEGIMLSFYSPRGKYLADLGNSCSGNVLLRRTQYRFADDYHSLEIAKSFIVGKLYNSKYLMLHFCRDHPMQVDVDYVKKVAQRITEYIQDIKICNEFNTLRGIEGNSAAEYFGVFNQFVLQNKNDFMFCGRNRRPPTDNINALLSFAYSLLMSECASALRSVGLDPYVGFMHTDRPGRKSLALDLMEELRSVYADRFVLTLINNRIVDGSDFEVQQSGAVFIKDNSRKKIISEWQKRKCTELVHPFLKEKIQWGLVPYVQAMLLSRYLRGDIDGYPPFLWK
ncbi:MAG: type I-C CRISPR-associated endonuclease Cas1c [Clostridiales bacterium]|nr:type I-C CRISPR-associated endonuclease Cas1c [Clostridiales bacterium]